MSTAHEGEHIQSGNSDIRLVSERIQQCNSSEELEKYIGIVIPTGDGKIAIQGATPNLAHLALVLSDMRDLLFLVRLSQEIIKRIIVLDEFRHHSEKDPHAKIINALGNFTAILGNRGFYGIAAGVLVDFWNLLGIYQYENKKRIYRAGIAMYLGRLYASYGEPGAAIWWLLHAHADDLLTPFDDGGAKQMLQLGFGVKKDVFDYMLLCSQENMKSSALHKKLFAEHVVTQVSLKPEYAYLFSRHTSLVEFQISRSYTRSMIDIIEPSSDGAPLEELARYLLLLLAGWVPTMNRYLDETRIDNDIIVRYVREPASISSARGKSILVECKNYKDPLGVQHVGYFLHRMHLTQTEVGILFAKKNVTGRKGAADKNAETLLTQAFHTDGITAIVIDLDDIKDLANERKTIWALIDTLIAERRFGRPPNPDAKQKAKASSPAKPRRKRAE
jgi:hypothetical protein